jgi:phosphomannomutase
LKILNFNAKRVAELVTLFFNYWSPVMAEELIIGISGLRGIVGENLTEKIARDYGCAFGAYLKRTAADDKKLQVCIGRDSRASGKMMLAEVAAGLCSAGIDVIDLGIVPTPSVGIMLRLLDCAGGVVITASHNPIQYNGIKLLSPEGVAPSPEAAAIIKKCYLDKDFIPAEDQGQVTADDRTDSIHIEKVLAIVDKDAIKAAGFKVVLDSVNGAGGPISVKLLTKGFGCKVMPINFEPDGQFAHTPEPTEENLIGLCDVVKEKGAQVGFAQDPDADRLAIVDENGKYIGEEYTLALAAKYILSKHRGKVATNLSTSRMVDDIAAQAGGEVIRTPVGEANVAAAMIENNCVIGGEGNGGIIDLRIGPIRDSLVGIALVLALMAETGKTVSQLTQDIGAYKMKKKKVAADKTMAAAVIDKAKELFPDAKLNTIDGCRFDFADGWLHLRSSNTEPVMRIIAESKDEGLTDRYIEKIENILSQMSG